MAPVRTGATAKFPSQGLLSRQRCGDSGVLSSGSEKSVGSWACCTPAQDRSQCAIISLEREAGAHHSAKYLLNHSYFLPNFSGLFFWVHSDVPNSKPFSTDAQTNSTCKCGAFSQLHQFQAVPGNGVAAGSSGEGDPAAGTRGREWTGEDAQQPKAGSGTGLGVLKNGFWLVYFHQRPDTTTRKLS